MNSSLQRFCNSRARLAHRSKDLEAVIVKLSSGAELHVGNRPTKRPGKTFNAGIQHLKRAVRLQPNLFPPGEIRRLKEAAWKHAARPRG